MNFNMFGPGPGNGGCLFQMIREIKETIEASKIKPPVEEPQGPINYWDMINESLQYSRKIRDEIERYDQSCKDMYKHIR